MVKKLNLGCGTDYRSDFMNIDGSSSLHKVDNIINIGQESLLKHFNKESFDYILANDILEHFFHWEAMSVLKEIYQLLTNNGRVEIRVPDCKYIIGSWRISFNKKLTLLFGGQDIPQYISREMDESRKKFPQFFCHKYGWTQEKMKEELSRIGFAKIKTKRSGINFIAYASKIIAK